MSNGGNNQVFNYINKDELDLFSEKEVTSHPSVLYKDKKLAPYQIQANIKRKEQYDQGWRWDESGSVIERPLTPQQKQLNKMQAESRAKEENRKNWTPEQHREEVHNKLLLAGFTPGIGNIADAADALLFASEGEWGSVGWSAASALPVIGQYVAGQRILKAAKESGEEIVKVYRGVDTWKPGRMVEDGHFVGAGRYTDNAYYKKIGGDWKTQQLNPKTIWTTKNFAEASSYTGHQGFFSDAAMTKWVRKEPGGVVLEFHIPKSYEINYGKTKYGDIKYFEEGIPKEFLTKVHKLTPDG